MDIKVHNTEYVFLIKNCMYNRDYRNRDYLLYFTNLVIEEPPSEKKIRWSGHRYGNSSYLKTFNLSMPHTFYFFIGRDYASTEMFGDEQSFLESKRLRFKNIGRRNFYMQISNKPFKKSSIKDFDSPPLGNVFASGEICLGDAPSSTAIENINRLWESRFNRDTIDAMYTSRLWKSISDLSDSKPMYMIKNYTYWQNNLNHESIANIMVKNSESNVLDYFDKERIKFILSNIPVVSKSYDHLISSQANRYKLDRELVHREEESFVLIENMDRAEELNAI